MKPLNNKKFFVVDDDPFVQAFLSQALNNLGYHQIQQFDSGVQCLENINQTPDVIFLDYQMDDMDGLEVLKSVKSLFPEVNIVFTTSVEDLNVAVQSISYGCSDFLLKKNITETEVEGILNRLSA